MSIIKNPLQQTPKLSKFLSGNAILFYQIFHESESLTRAKKKKTKNKKNNSTGCSNLTQMIFLKAEFFN